MRSSPRQHLLSAALATALGTAFLSWSSLATAQTPGQATRVFDVSVAAQPLSSALNELSRQTGMQFFAAGDVVAGVQSPRSRAGSRSSRRSNGCWPAAAWSPFAAVNRK